MLVCSSVVCMSVQLVVTKNKPRRSSSYADGTTQDLSLSLVLRRLHIEEFE